MFVDGAGGSGGSPVYSQSSQKTSASNGARMMPARTIRFRKNPSRVRRERRRASSPATASSPEKAPQRAQRPSSGAPSALM